MKKTSLILSLLLILFAGGVYASEKPIKIDCSKNIYQLDVCEIKKNYEFFIESEALKTHQVETEKYNLLKDYKARARLYITDGRDIVIKDPNGIYDFVCKTDPNELESRKLVGALFGIPEGEGEVFLNRFFIPEGSTKFCGPEKPFYVHGYASQEEAKASALLECENYYNARCVIAREGEENVYSSNYQKFKEDLEQEIYMAELIERCEGFGFEGDQQIAACIQQEVFNEKKLALQKQELLESRKQLAEQKSNKSYLQMLNGLANLSNVLLQQKVTKQRKEIQRQNKCRRISEGSKGKRRCIK